MSLCLCTTGPLTNIDQDSCRSAIGQLVRFAFYKSGNVQFENTANNINTLASWTPYLTAVDDTHVIVSPLIDIGGAIAGGEPNTLDGGTGESARRNGATSVAGFNPSTLSITFENLTKEQEAQIDQIMCGDYEMFMFPAGSKNIIAEEVDATTQKGFRIVSAISAPIVVGGHSANDNKVVTIQIPWDWSKKRTVIEAVDFDPLNIAVFS